VKDKNNLIYIEKTLKESLIEAGTPAQMGEGRTPEIFAEEFSVVCNEIEKLISGSISPINPNSKLLASV
jgi:hypothetical protein